MNVEVEIKVILKDPKQAEEKILEIGKFLKTRKQIDKYFSPKDENYYEEVPAIKYLRVREEDGKNHLNYSYCHLADDESMLSTDEYEVEINSPEVAGQILEKIGMVLRITVTKERKYFEVGDFEVTVDHIEELGYFMEIEAKKDFGGVDETRKACFNLLEKLGIDYKKAPDLGYPSMVEEKKKNPEFLKKLVPGEGVEPSRPCDH